MAAMPRKAASSGRASARSEIEQFLDGRGAVRSTLHDEDELLDSRRRAAGRREGRRLVSGPDGVRPARPGSAQHPRRSALAEDAGDDEPEDQVPRELPAVRPVRAAGTRARVVRHAARTRKARTCCWSPRCSEKHRVAVADEQTAADGRRPGPAPARQRRPLHDPGHHARGLQRPRADRGRRAQPALLPPDDRRSTR